MKYLPNTIRKITITPVPYPARGRNIINPGFYVKVKIKGSKAVEYHVWNYELEDFIENLYREVK